MNVWPQLSVNLSNRIPLPNSYPIPLASLCFVPGCHAYLRWSVLCVLLYVQAWMWPLTLSLWQWMLCRASCPLASPPPSTCNTKLNNSIQIQWIRLHIFYFASGFFLRVSRKQHILINVVRNFAIRFGSCCTMAEGWSIRFRNVVTSTWHTFIFLGYTVRGWWYGYIYACADDSLSRDDTKISVSIYDWIRRRDKVNAWLSERGFRCWD